MSIKVECKRCGGTGYINAYEHIDGGVCFACQGKGYLDDADFDRLNKMQ